MEQEQFFTGYCRTQDCSRMVCAVKENRKLLEADCSYEACPYTAECTIAQAIAEFLSDQ